MVASTTDRSPFLSFQRLTIAFGRRVLFSNVDFQATGGEILALFGPNGSGKTSLLNAISGFLPVSGGTVAYFGSVPAAPSPTKIASLGGGVVRTFQVPALVNSLTVLDHLLIAQNAPGGESAKADAPRSSRTMRLSAAVDEMVSRVNFHDKLLTPTITLSFGERRIVANLCSCIRPAKIMLLDEPFANLSIAAVEGMKEIFRRLATVEGRLIVMTEHHPRYVAGFASRFMQVHEKNLKELPVQHTTESAVREMLVKQKIDYD